MDNAITVVPPSVPPTPTETHPPHIEAQAGLAHHRDPLVRVDVFVTVPHRIEVEGHEVAGSGLAEGTRDPSLSGWVLLVAAKQVARPYGS